MRKLSQRLPVLNCCAWRSDFVTFGIVRALTPQPPLPLRGRGGVKLPRPADGVRQAARDNRKSPTESERIIWNALRGRKLGGRKFRRQQPIGPFIVDFYCHEESLAIEVDGGIHETQSTADKQRQLAIESLGIRFVRIPSKLVETDLPAALKRIQASLSEHISPSPAHGRGARGEG